MAKLGKKVTKTKNIHSFPSNIVLVDSRVTQDVKNDIFKKLILGATSKKKSGIRDFVPGGLLSILGPKLQPKPALGDHVVHLTLGATLHQF